MIDNLVKQLIRVWFKRSYKVIKRQRNISNRGSCMVKYTYLQLYAQVQFVHFSSENIIQTPAAESEHSPDDEVDEYGEWFLIVIRPVVWLGCNDSRGQNGLVENEYDQSGT